MKRLGIFLFWAFLSSCDEEDFSIEQRITIGNIKDQIAFLDMELLGENNPGFVLELQSGGKFKYLSVSDNYLICNSIDTDDCMGWHNSYLQDYISKNDLLPSRNSGRRLWYRVSGLIKPIFNSDKFVGNPFVLTKAERILSCPVAFKEISGQVPLSETDWRMVGFMDENGVIYSHPACESNNVKLQFTLNSLDDYPFNIPNGKRIELSTGNYLSFQSEGRVLSYSIFGESEKIRIGYVSSPYFIPGFRNYVRHDGPRTTETINKSDSLIRLLGGYDTLDYILEKNILKLSNTRTKLKAMFVAN